MARRNIFDRMTRAGDYSDTLGSFIESIPSIYGQLAKEKRLERLDREDRNFRTTQYNNQLLQQARNNRRQDETAQLTREKFEQDKKNKNLQNEILLATGIAESTGDYRPLIQLRQRNFSTSMDEQTNQNEIEKVTQFMSNKDDFESRLDDFNSLSYMEKFNKGNELRDLISISSRFSKVGDNQSKNYYKQITKNLRDTLKDVSSKSGKNILNTDLWDNPTLVDAYDGLGRDIKEKENQISSIQTEINKILPTSTRTAGSNVPSSLNRLAVLNKDGEVQKDEKGNTKLETLAEYTARLASLGYSRFDVKNLIELNNRITSLRNERANLTLQKNNLIPKYPVYNDNYEENLETMKVGKPSVPEDNQPVIVDEAVESDILSKIDDMDEEGISEFLSAVESDDVNALNDYFYGKSDINQVNQVDDEPEQAPVNLANVETEPNEQINLELENENVLQDETKPESEDTILPTLSANSPVQQFTQGIARDESLPPIDMGQQREKVLQEAEKYDVPAIPETESINSIARYLTEDLSKNLNTVISLRKEIKGIENRNSQSINRFYRKKKDRLSKLEKDIKSKIGDFINPVSGDISISNQSYKNAIFKRLEKEFGSELYPALASLSNIKK